MTGRPRGGMAQPWSASSEHTAARHRPVRTTVVLQTVATTTSPALILRPWLMEDVAALVEVFRDPAMRHWTSHVVENEADGARWIRDQQRGWAAGNRFGFAVCEPQPSPAREQLVGNVVLKEITSSRPVAEVGYWTAAHARGRGVAPRALETLTSWAFGTFEADGLKRLELLHQIDNLASCQVARKSGYDLDRILPAAPPSFPHEGHLHTRHASA
ncbi:GNAT family N-acetyltransferase [Amycolatopsis azurea]|uniref:GNAT family N-acetyltransferase n=1 Tax=Amycolatopsis azurea TaxID=36819 RepID=UPI0037F760AB